MILFHETLLKDHHGFERIFQQIKHVYVMCLDIILSQHDDRVNGYLFTIKENMGVLTILGMRVT